MTILLDTHTLIWFLQDDPKLSKSAKALIRDPVPTVLVSVVTYWGIAIKPGSAS